LRRPIRFGVQLKNKQKLYPEGAKTGLRGQRGSLHSRMASMNQLFRQGAFEAGSALSEGTAPNSLELYEEAASLVSAGAWSCDLSSERLTWTAGVFDIFGLANDQAPERREIVEMYGEESRELLDRRRSHAIATRSGFTLDASIVRADGAKRWIRITAATRSANGRAERLYGMKQDITDDHARWELLRAQAECDPLTGVANRACFQRFLERPKDEFARDGIGALILFDMDGFKQVNDWWGHAAGDACLSAFGERLRTTFPHARLVSRIGGDEFAVLLPRGSSRSETEAAVRSSIGTLQSPVPWNGDLLPLCVSVGLAFSAEDTEQNPQQLFVTADRALYIAKENRSLALVCA
jgi:diguanylate cyclase (GGDEF)-like protein/PAS domain S-box-containing protein